MEMQQLHMTEYNAIQDLNCYEINVEQNPDRWRGGFVWSVSLGTEELGNGLEFSRRLAQQKADEYMTNLLCPN
ncbi:hypothetical protein [Undibacterium macrobrachii]|uniref:DRBM domain-containing protein n=1 Tax=Undibacterium macrobrachii TaxID=1119058 RepID=A0ABQ2XCK2_9BURK|nr:hypothetical protein [Undibacterium macrobrachii]GGX10714.1 hypothetical protein GCM10011282_16260 [Undibacterium macrobrachii]